MLLTANLMHNTAAQVSLSNVLELLFFHQARCLGKAFAEWLFIKPILHSVRWLRIGKSQQACRLLFSAVLR